MGLDGRAPGFYRRVVRNRVPQMSEHFLLQFIDIFDRPLQTSCNFARRQGLSFIEHDCQIEPLGGGQAIGDRAQHRDRRAERVVPFPAGECKTPAFPPPRPLARRLAHPALPKWRSYLCEARPHRLPSALQRGPDPAPPRWRRAVAPGRPSPAARRSKPPHPAAVRANSKAGKFLAQEPADARLLPAAVGAKRNCEHDR